MRMRSLKLPNNAIFITDRSFFSRKPAPTKTAESSSSKKDCEQRMEVDEEVENKKEAKSEVKSIK